MKKSPTFGAVFISYCAYARQRLKTCKEIVRIHNRYLAGLDHKYVSEISRADLQQIHSDLGTVAGRTSANRAIQLVSTVINHGIDFGLYEGINPASRIKKFREKSRDRFLRPQEFDRLFQAINGCHSKTVRDFIYICLYTGARCGNVMSMKWSELDLYENTWCIPDSKNGEPYTIPLVPQAIEVIQKRSSLMSCSAYVFPGPDCKKPMTNPRETWYKILGRAGIKDLRVHDLRRSLASWQAMTGASLPIIGKTLNHKDARSTSIYARLDITPVRTAIETAVNTMHLMADQKGRVAVLER